MAGDRDEPTAIAPPSTEPKITVIRVKRKRTTEAPDNLVIEGLGSKPKRPNTLTDALTNLALASSTINDDAPAQPPLPTRRHRFQKVTTLTAKQLTGIDEAHIAALLSSTKRTTPSSQNPKSALQPVNSGIQKKTFSTRYEQIMKRRGLTNFERTEAAPDPLARVTQLYDVVCHDDSSHLDEVIDHKHPEQAASIATRGNQPTEEEILSNYMPMVNEYLGNQPDKDTEDVAMDEYVYDLYVSGPASSSYPDSLARKTISSEDKLDDNGSHQQNIAEEEEDLLLWEQHLLGHAPVVTIIDDDTWLVMEADDRTDTDEDSEDSNAEGYFGNDYPEEESDGDTSDDDDAYVRGHSVGGRQYPVGTWGDDESYGSSDYEYDQ